MNRYIPVNTPPMHSRTSRVNQKLRLLLQHTALCVSKHARLAWPCGPAGKGEPGQPSGVVQQQQGRCLAGHPLPVGDAGLLGAALRADHVGLQRLVCLVQQLAPLLHHSLHGLQAAPRRDAPCPTCVAARSRQQLGGHLSHTCVLRFRPAAKATSSSVSCSCAPAEHHARSCDVGELATAVRGLPAGRCAAAGGRPSCCWEGQRPAPPSASAPGPAGLCAPPGLQPWTCQLERAPAQAGGAPWLLC